MVDILKQFNPEQTNKAYKYGKVVSIRTGGVLTIRITSGLELVIKDKSQVYSIGDQVVLGIKDDNLNSVFIIRKINRQSQSSINFVIS